MSELTQVLEDVLRLESQGEPGVMITLFDTGGSSPRHGVARMVVHADGSIVGTIGGGPLEHAMMHRSREVLERGVPVLEVATLESLGMTCGGTVRVLLEPVGVCPNLVLFGAGHVAAEIAPLAARCGFAVSVVDDRPELASRERFPDAKQLIHSFDPESWTALSIGAQSFCVVVTRGHEHDYNVVRALIDKKLAYLGMMGSKKKVAGTRERLKESGVPRQSIDRLHAPIGIEINSETPAEIAVSIVGELIKVRRQASSP